MTELNQKVYNATIDILKVIAILAVICIHTTTRTLEASSFDLQKVPLTLFLNQASRFGVPLFFLLSGFVLELNYPYHASYLSYLKKRLSKIFIPYVFWSAIYFFFVYKDSDDFLGALITGSASYQLYFIPTLLVFYMLFPFFHAYYKVITHAIPMIILGILQITFLYYTYYIHPLPFFYPLSIALLNFYVFILGSVASHHEQRLMTIMSKLKYVLLILVAVLVGYVFFEGYNGYLITHNYLSFYSQWRPSILFYTITLGGLLYYLLTQNISHFPFAKSLAKLSYVVFFVHVISLEVIWYIVGKNVFFATHSNVTQQIWFDPLFFALTAFISFSLAFILSKIPFLKKVTG